LVIATSADLYGPLEETKTNMNATNFIAAVWGLLLARPQLFTQHMQGYAALMRNEAELAAAYMRYRLCLWVALVVCAVMFLGFLGIALMMWGTTPSTELIHAWIFVLVPALPFTGFVLTWIALRQQPPHPWWDELQGQIAADMALLDTHVN